MGILLDLTDEEIEKMAEAIGQEMLKEHEARQKFTLERQDEAMALFASFVTEHKLLDNEDFSYKEEQTSHLNAEEFYFLFDNMMDAAEELNKQYVDPENIFQNVRCFITYNGVQLTFFRMWGQGTSSQIYVDSESWLDELAISYDEVKALQAMQNEEIE